MRKQINPAVAVVVVIVAVLGVGLLAWKMMDFTQSNSEKQVIVKPANPDDPRYHPDPKLGLSGSGT